MAGVTYLVITKIWIKVLLHDLRSTKFTPTLFNFWIINAQLQTDYIMQLHYSTVFR